MQIKPKKRSGRKVILWALLAIPALIFLIASLNRYLEHLVENELLENINLDPKRAYDYQIGDVSIGIIRGTITIDSLQVVPQDDFVDSLHEDKQKDVVWLNVDQFALSGLSIWRLLVFNDIIIDNIDIRDPHFNYVLNPITRQEPKPIVLSKVFSDVFEIASIGQIAIYDADFTFTDISLDTLPSFALNVEDIHLRDIVIDSASLNGLIPIGLDALEIEFGRISADISEYNSIEIAGLSITAEDSTLRVDQFALVPRQDRETFNKMIDTAKDWLDIKAAEVRLRHIQFDKWDTRGIFNASMLEITGPDIFVYKDNRLPKREPQLQRLPSYLFKSVPLPFTIDSIKVVEGKVVYQEQVDNGQPHGEISFAALHATGHNLTNDSSRWENYPDFVLNAQARFMDLADFDVTFTFPMPDAENTFIIEGKLGEFPAKKLNPVTRNLALVGISSGTIRGVDFQFEADIDSANGTLELEYEDLGIKFLDKDKPQKSKGLLSFLANLVIKKDNKRGKKFEIVELEYARPHTDPFFGYCWNVLKFGMMKLVLPGVLEGQFD